MTEVQNPHVEKFNYAKLNAMTIKDLLEYAKQHNIPMNRCLKKNSMIFKIVSILKPEMEDQDDYSRICPERLRQSVITDSTKRRHFQSMSNEELEYRLKQFILNPSEKLFKSRQSLIESLIRLENNSYHIESPNIFILLGKFGLTNVNNMTPREHLFELLEQCIIDKPDILEELSIYELIEIVNIFHINVDVSRILCFQKSCQKVYLLKYINNHFFF